jgi:hypothetical protein
MIEKPSWNTDIKAPLVKSSLTIANIIRDTSAFRTDADNSIIMVNRSEVYNLNVDSLVKLQVVPFQKNVKLSTLKLNSQTIVRPVTLGELARAMQADGDPMGDFILNSHGQWIFFPGMNNLTAGPMDVDINQFFEYAELLTGTMDIKIENKLPVNITNVEFELRNKNLGDQIAHETFSNLNKNTSQSRSVDLAGKTIEGNLIVNVLDMDLGSGFAQIDTNDAIIITLTVKNVTVQSATAIFPAQNVIDEESETSFLLSEVQLKEAVILNGMVEAEAYSTAEDTVYFTYSIPSAKKNGVPFVMNTVIPPAPPGGTKYAYFSADFSGYTMDLTGKPGHDTVNTFYSHLVGRIEYTGKKVNLSLSDSLFVEVRLVNAVPSYVRGYLGRDTIDVGSGSVSIDVFKNIESGTLNFESVKLKAIVENGLGIPGEYQINSIQAVNTKTGQTQTLNISPSGPVAAATDNPYTAATTILDLSNGSNAIDLLNILPDKINYNVRLITNPAGFTSYNDFAYSGSSLKPLIEMEIPLSLFAENLVLSDTADFISDNFQTTVNSGSFSIHVDNGFPLNGDLKLYFLDNNGVVIDSVVSSGTILAAPVDATNKVTGKRFSKITFHVDNNRMQTILRSRKIVFKVKFSTEPGSTFLKIYSDYSIDFKLTGDFNYTIK